MGSRVQGLCLCTVLGVALLVSLGALRCCSVLRVSGLPGP